MPRVELLAEVPDLDDGSETYDVCRDCAGDIQEGDDAVDHFPQLSLCQIYRIGSVDVEHPPYDECEYVCDGCDRLLTSKDD